MRVIVERDDHGYTARLTGEQGSQLLTSLAKADGLAIISEHTRIMSSQAAKSRYRCSIGRRKGNAHVGVLGTIHDRLSGLCAKVSWWFHGIVCQFAIW